MSASPIIFNPCLLTPQSNRLRREWLPVLCSLVFICLTSTAFMGAPTTQAIVNAVWKTLFGTWHWNLTGEVNGICRKIGHLFGYGMVGLIFRNAWYKSAQAFAWVVRSRLTPFASMLAVASTFAVACLDEWHQRFVPGRVGSLRDALVDAMGAVLLNVFVWEFRAYKRKKVLAAL
jgi:VanZ family protein